MSLLTRIQATGRRLAFRPILSGASLRDRLIACLGAVAGIGLTALVGQLTAQGLEARSLVLIAAPLGASAVLAFVVPSSPMTQPWSIIGGHIISALVGLAVARFVSDVALAAGLSVGLAIGAMSLLRCLHPPGGGTALIPVIGGAAIQSAGLGFVLAPMALNAITLTAAAWLFHRLISGHSYPHRPLPAPPTPQITDADIDAALAAIDGPVDISRADLKGLVQLAVENARARR
jgi:CBS domain-containing membrane protein